MDGGRVTGPEAARRLLPSSRLRRLATMWDGGQVFLTGGSLRDRLLGVPTHDLDLAVTGDPEAAARAFAAALGGRSFPLGRAPLVTWRVVGAHGNVDVWGIGESVERDIFRRDFTVNALFWRLPRGPLLDLVGGLDDLAAGRIRVVRHENLLHDPLRVLRGVRLLATHPRLRLTHASEEQLASAAPGLQAVARERVCDELRILLAGPGVERALLVAARIGILAAIFPAWDGYTHARTVAGLAVGLARAQSGAGAFAHGALEVAPAVLASPAAGFPERWELAAATASLAEAGWPPRAAQLAAGAAALGEALAAVLGRDTGEERALAVRSGELFEAALAWAVARRGAAGPEAGAPAARLLRWWRRFAAVPPLLPGDEIAALLRLPPSPARSEAVRALREAHARGEVRTPAQARRFLVRAVR